MLVCQGEFFIIFDLGYFGPQGAVYSMSLYSDGIIFKFRFQKSHFMTKNKALLTNYINITLTYVHHRPFYGAYLQKALQIGNIYLF